MIVQVKKRLRTVKRGVVKRELATEGSKLNVREVQKESRMQQALAGFIKPERRKKNAFRSDDPDAEIPQHNFRQGPDFRSGFAGPDAGYAVVGSNRPKFIGGADAPTAVVVPKQQQGSMEVDLHAHGVATDPKLARLLRTTEQVVPKYASKRVKRRLKNKSGIDHDAPHRWT